MIKREIELSIIVCAFNEEETIEKSIKKIFEQVGHNQSIETFIIDNESSDRTFQISQDIISSIGFKNVSLVSINHCPLTHSRNTGLKLSNGKFIAYVDADGWIDKSWLKEVFLSISKDFDICCGTIDISDNADWFSKLIFNSHYKPSLLSSESGLIGANMVFKKSVLSEAGGFHTVPTSRGDETLIHNILIEKNPDLKIINNPNQKFVNSYVDNLTDWFKLQFLEGVSGGSFHRSKKPYSLIFHITIKLFSLFFIPALFLLFFTGLNAYLLLLILFGFIRHAARNKYYKQSILYGLRAYKFYYLLVFPIIVLGSIPLDFGFIRGSLIGRSYLSSSAPPSEVVKTFKI